MKKKKRQWFLILLPNGRELLVSSHDGYFGLVDILPYINEKYEDNTFAVPLRWREVVKFILGGKVIAYQ